MRYKSTVIIIIINIIKRDEKRIECERNAAL